MIGRPKNPRCSTIGAASPSPRGSNCRPLILQRLSECARGRAFPTTKRMAEVGRLAEPKRTRDIVDRHLRVAQILRRHFRPQLIEDRAEGRSFLTQFPAQRPFGNVEVRGDIFQAHGPPKLAEQEAADLSRDTDPMLETVMQVVAEGQH